MERKKGKLADWLKEFKNKVSQVKTSIGKAERESNAILVFLFLAAAGCLVIFAAGISWITKQENISGGPVPEVRTLSAPEGEAYGEPEQETEKVAAYQNYTEIPVINFQEQWKINKDVCAWIWIPDTLVNCPVLRNGSSDDPHDEYYLETTIGGEDGLPGSIYMEPCNSPEFTDFNTVIYGHNMKNGTMFGELDELADNEFFETHEYVYVIMPEQVMIYRIYGWVNYDDRHLMLSFDFSEEAQCQAFLDSFAEVGTESRFRENMEVTPESRILTLSTCVKGQEDRRFLVEAVLAETIQPTLP